MPSGQGVRLHEVLVETLEAEVWVRFRFVAPQIARGAGQIGFDRAAGDMDHLCAELALPYLAEHALSGDVIVVSLADRPVDFGATDPDATQFFEAYRPDGAACVPEGL